MRRITSTIEIDAPAHDVYVALRSLDAYPQWLHRSVVYRRTDAAARHPGTGEYEDSTMIGRMRGAVLTDDPDRTLRFHQAKPSGRVDADIRYDLGASTGGTYVTRVGELTTHGVFRAVQPMLVRMAAAESRRTLRALKAHCEHLA